MEKAWREKKRRGEEGRTREEKRRGGGEQEKVGGEEEGRTRESRRGAGLGFQGCVEGGGIFCETYQLFAYSARLGEVDRFSEEPFRSTYLCICTAVCGYTSIVYVQASPVTKIQSSSI